MVLDIPGVQGLFKNSPYQGDGYGSNVAQRRRNEGRQGAILSLMHSNKGSSIVISPATEIVDYFTVHKGDFLIDEEIEIVIKVWDSSTGATQGLIQIRMADEGSGTTIANLMTAGKGSNTFTMRLGQKFDIDNDITGDILKQLGNGSVAKLFGDWDMSQENIITKQFTISLIANVLTGGTIYWDWFIYRRGHN